MHTCAKNQESLQYLARWPREGEGGRGTEAGLDPVPSTTASASASARTRTRTHTRAPVARGCVGRTATPRGHATEEQLPRLLHGCCTAVTHLGVIPDQHAALLRERHVVVVVLGHRHPVVVQRHDYPPPKQLCVEGGKARTAREVKATSTKRRVGHTRASSTRRRRASLHALRAHTTSEYRTRTLRRVRVLCALTAACSRQSRSLQYGGERAALSPPHVYNRWAGSCGGMVWGTGRGATLPRVCVCACGRRRTLWRADRSLATRRGVAAVGVRRLRRRR